MPVAPAEDRALIALAGAVVAALRASGRTLALAESCTGGQIAATITAVAGASAVLDRGWVTYSNRAKVEELGVDVAILVGHGAVSAETAAAMAAGALGHAPVDVTLAVTGIAGPEGGSAEKPVGLVWFGLAQKGVAAPQVERHVFSGDRAAVRRAAVRRGLELVLGSRPGGD
ncbi:MAG: nicotinamide-nucleotide amidohydrolase family protein [Rhodospirillaceae bacterium]